MVSLVLALASQALAGEKDPRAVGADKFYGSVNQSLPIEVPAFHGIQPQLALSYSSSGGKGPEGTGWSLSGPGVIERVSTVGGIASYDNSDTYRADGTELLACGSLVSPSCANGGTHVSKKENYLRYKFDQQANAWTITSKDGVKSTYTALYTTSKGTQRWGLAAVVDRNVAANTTTYNWSCNGADCNPSLISYNGVTVNFWYDTTRPDPRSFATGAGLGVASSRLKTIDVKVGGSRLRAYKLGYTNPGLTQPSLLTSVQMFGKDATLDGSNNVTGGTSMPAETFTYNSAAGAPFTSWVEDIHATGEHLYIYPTIAADISGDGKSDICHMSWTYLSNTLGTWSSKCVLGVGNGTFGAPTVTAHGNFTGGWDNSGWKPTLQAHDIDGDGKQDLCVLARERGTEVRCARSLGNGSFAAATTYTFPTALGYPKTPELIDINRDGRSDYCIGEWGSTIGWRTHCAIGNGAGGFAAPVLTTHQGPSMWLDPGDTWRMYSADVNADGRSDLCAIETRYQFKILCARSNGDGSFAAPVSTPHTLFNNSGGVAMDLNGDGATDFCSNNYPDPASLTTNCILGNGDGSFGASVTHDFGITDRLTLNPMELNGDGLADICFTQTGGAISWSRCFVGKGDGHFVAASSQTNMYEMALPMVSGGANWKHHVMDWNGDGVDELCFVYVGQDFRSRCIGNTANAPLLMNTAVNGAGATTTVAYTPSSAFASSNNPPVVYAVTSIGVADGRGGVSTDSYSYSGGLYDRVDRRFLGFRYAKETQPCITGESLCPYSETWWKQDYGSVSKPEEVRTSTGSGLLQSMTQHVYLTNGSTVPYTSVESETWRYQYDGSGASCGAWPQGTVCAYGRRSVGMQSYDAYGNTISEQSYGDYDLSGDEKTTTAAFVPNTTDYIVSKQVSLRVYAGIGTGGALLEELLSYFDGASTWNQAPTRGLLSKSAKWLSSPSSYVNRTIAYDNYGNATSETDELGAIRTKSFDATYRVNLVGETNELGQTVNTATSFDAVCGVSLASTNLNGLAQTMQYDALCRPTRTDYADGSFLIRSYVNTGNPNTQYVQEEKPGPAGAGNLWSRVYRDGRGREWRTVSSGPTVGQEIYSDTTFNPRGFAVSSSRPYYLGQTVYADVTSYDQQNRPTRVTHPDGTYLTTTYGLSDVVTVDELMAEQRDTVDMDGRRSKHAEKVSGVWHTTSYAYDVRGNMTGTTDPVGNVWQFTYDSLRRRKQLIDPDAGTTNLSYDALGRQISQTDAKGQITTSSYDARGRRTAKTICAAGSTGGCTLATVTWTYDEARSGYYNKGKLTTATDALGSATFNHNNGGYLVQGTRNISGTNYTFTKGYDLGGRSLWTTYADGTTMGTSAASLQYDAAGRLKVIPGLVTSVLYDAAGQLTQLTNANGTVTTRTYSAQRGWLTGINTVKGATVIQNLTYTRDLRSSITQVTSPIAGESWTYGYNSSGHLTSAVNASDSAMNQTFTYDALGNMTNNSRLGNYSYPTAGAARPHAVTSAGANSYSYDANGNMLTGAGRTMVWDADNRPVNINGATFSYDANGDRIKRVSGGVTSLYLGDDYEITAGTATKYVSIGEMLVAKVVGTTSYTLHIDHQNSIQAITDSAGVEVQRLKYRPYGDRMSTGTAHSEQRGYTGQRQDQSGLFYLHARYFDPVLARFASADPTVPSGSNVGLNRYAYAYNDPINHTDINGMFGFGWLKKAVKAVGSVVRTAVGVVGMVVGAVAWAAGKVSGKDGWTAFGATAMALGLRAVLGDDNAASVILNGLMPGADKGGNVGAPDTAQEYTSNGSDGAPAANAGSANGGYTVAIIANPVKDSPTAGHMTAQITGPDGTVKYLEMGVTGGDKHPLAAAVLGAGTFAYGKESLDPKAPNYLVGTFHMTPEAYTEFQSTYLAFCQGQAYLLGDSNKAMHLALVHAGFPEGVHLLSKPAALTRGYFGWNNPDGPRKSLFGKQWFGPAPTGYMPFPVGTNSPSLGRTRAGLTPKPAPRRHDQPWLPVAVQAETRAA